MYPGYQLIQIVEVPKNGDLSPYAVRFYGRMEYFEFDFMCKSTLKKFFAKHKMQDGKYLIIHESEHSGDVYVVDAVCIYCAREKGSFLDFKLPGKEWTDLVNNVMENTEMLDIGLRIKTINKITIPQIGVAPGDGTQDDTDSEVKTEEKE